MMDAVFNPAIFLASFTTILVIQDPLGAVPIFLSLTRRQGPSERRASARQATLLSFGVILAFAIFGRYILGLLGISVAALQVSGGLLLLLVALELLTEHSHSASETEPADSHVALVPLGTPLLAGPGAIVAAMVAVESAPVPTAGWVSVTLAIIAVHVITWLSLRFSLTLHRVLGEAMILVLTRVMGLLLAAIAVQMIGDGVTAYISEHF
ncbi:MarC family protein [Actinomyces timonensis]|uniref:MarC family protein n=1 Tax=Actinomyces timonensis TaxID=1288391 RepID=UPI000474C162|nr:MarC family protein [Actinomyces timonensis]